MQYLVYLLFQSYHIKFPLLEITVPALFTAKWKLFIYIHLYFYFVIRFFYKIKQTGRKRKSTKIPVIHKLETDLRTAFVEHNAHTNKYLIEVLV